MKALKLLTRSLLAPGLLLALACTTDSPNTPTAPPTGPVPPAVGVNVSVTASNADVEVGSTESSIITIRANRADNGQPVPNLTRATVTTTLGGFGSVGGPTSVEVELIGGQGQLAFFGGGTVGTATIRAQVSNGVGFTTVNVREPGDGDTFFLSSVTPNTGSPQGGETVTINGGGFADPMRVTFNGVPAQIQNASTTHITVTTPPLLSGLPPGSTQAVTVAVTINLNEEGEETDSLNSGFIYVNGGGGGSLQPTIFSVTPASGPNEGGTQVTINGDGFEAPVQVKFGTGTLDSNFNGAEATVNSVTRTRIVVTAPPTSCNGCAPPTPNQLVNILVKNLNTSRFTVATSAYRYGSDVVITSISPGEGPATGGTLVTIFGQGFDEPVAVTMGQHAQQVLSVSGSEVVVRTVAILISSCADVSGPTSLVNIETGDGATGPAFTYRVSRPIISGISPNFGGQAGGTAVTITGFNFQAPLTVSFDTFTGSVGAVTSTTVAATTPPFPDSLFTSSATACDDDADGTSGIRFGPVSVDVTLRSPVTTCTSTLTGAFRVNPTNTTCQGD